jgi:DNA-binding CsgD family transcriptional regulator
VLPLCAGRLRSLLVPGTIAAIFIGGASQSRVPSGEIVAALFDLTPAERLVFEHIVSGRKVAETAAELGIGTGTVRTHLLRLLDKTGVHCQADLLALAASFDPFIW